MAKIADLHADITANTSGLKQGLDNAKSQLRGFADSLKGTESGGVDAFMGILGAVSSMTAAIITAKKVFAFAQEGAQIASLEMASHRLAKSYGANMSEIVASLKNASFNTITEYGAMKAANLAMTMGVSADAEQLGQLLQISTMRARAFGLSTEEAFDKITRGIGRRSVKILDDLGFNIVGATSVQDMFNKVLEQGNKELDDMGGLTMDVSTAYQRVNTVYNDFLNDVKMGAGYGFMPFFTSPEETAQINRQRAQLALLTGSYKDYLTAKYAEMGMGGVTGPRAPMTVMTEYEFEFTRSSKARSDDIKQALLEGVLTQEQYTDAMSLQIAVAGELSSIMAGYNSIVSDANSTTEQITAATDKATASLQDYAFEMLTSNMDIEQHGEFIMKAAVHFGQMTQAEFEAARAGQALQNFIQENNLSWEESQPLIDMYNEGLEGMMAGGSSNYFVHIWQIVHSSGTGMIPSGFGNMPNNELNKKAPVIIGGGMHGGSFRGYAHGGVVPPGYPNDGMPVMVSSGEELKVRPAGNSSKGGDGNTFKFYGPVSFKVSDDMRTIDLMEQLR